METLIRWLLRKTVSTKEWTIFKAAVRSTGAFIMSPTLFPVHLRWFGLLVLALLKHHHWLSSGCLTLIGQTLRKVVETCLASCSCLRNMHGLSWRHGKSDLDSKTFRLKAYLASSIQLLKTFRLKAYLASSIQLLKYEECQQLPPDIDVICFRISSKWK